MPLFIALPTPTYLGNDAAESGAGGATGAMTAATVYLLAISNPVGCVVSGMRTHVGASPTGYTDMGIYTFDGNTLLVHTGAVLNVASTTMTNNFSSNYYLGPGNYFLAFTASAADTYSKVPVMSVPGAISNFRIATNAATGSAGTIALPATLGTILAPASGGSPLFGGVVVGGLP